MIVLVHSRCLPDAPIILIPEPVAGGMAVTCPVVVSVAVPSVTVSVTLKVPGVW